MLSDEERRGWLEEARRPARPRLKQSAPDTLDTTLAFLDQVQTIFGPYASSPRKMKTTRNKL